MVATGINPQGKLVEIVEVKDHPWFVGVQFHPEYRSTVMKPHALFVGFVQAAVKQGAAPCLWVRRRRRRRDRPSRPPHIVRPGECPVDARGW
jgi:hypothetical protein